MPCRRLVLRLKTVMLHIVFVEPWHTSKGKQLLRSESSLGFECHLVLRTLRLFAVVAHGECAPTLVGLQLLDCVSCPLRELETSLSEVVANAHKGLRTLW